MTAARSSSARQYYLKDRRIDEERDRDEAPPSYITKTTHQIRTTLSVLFVLLVGQLSFSNYVVVRHLLHTSSGLCYLRVLWLGLRYLYVRRPKVVSNLPFESNGGRKSEHETSTNRRPEPLSRNEANDRHVPLSVLRRSFTLSKEKSFEISGGSDDENALNDESAPLLSNSTERTPEEDRGEAIAPSSIPIRRRRANAPNSRAKRPSSESLANEMFDGKKMSQRLKES